MPRQAAYKSLEVYHVSRKLVVACYELTHSLPAEEKTNFSRYIRTAALNLHVNIAQGIFRKNKKRKKYLRGARHALVAIDAATEILVEVGFCTAEDVDVISALTASCFQLLDQC